MDWGLAGSVILSGLVIVFMVLVILIFLVSLTSKAVGGSEPKREEVSPSAPKPAAAAFTPAPAPVVQAGIEEETVAAISAAVYSCMDSAAPGAQYVIRSIKRAAGERPVWGFAGMQQNTRPF